MDTFGISDKHIAEKQHFTLRKGLPQIINWENYGLRIHASKNSVSFCDTVEIFVNALVGGNFKFPENTELVSAIYAISTSRPLDQPITLDVQHSIKLTNEEQLKYLKFAVASDKIPKIAYEFSIVEGGKFQIGNYYGSIDRTTFSFICIVGERFNSCTGDDPSSPSDSSSSSSEEELLNKTNESTEETGQEKNDGCKTKGMNLEESTAACIPKSCTGRDIPESE